MGTRNLMERLFKLYRPTAYFRMHVRRLADSDLGPMSFWVRVFGYSAVKVGDNFYFKLGDSSTYILTSGMLSSGRVFT